MKRSDMQGGVLYAIKRSHHAPRPGFVLDPGKSPGKVAVRIYWSWPSEDMLETDGHVIVQGTPEEAEVGTADVVSTWKQYATQRRAERQARLDAIVAEDAEREATRAAFVARVAAILPALDGMNYAPTELTWAAKSDQMHTRRWSAAEVLAVIEHLIENDPTPPEGDPS